MAKGAVTGIVVSIIGLVGTAGVQAEGLPKPVVVRTYDMFGVAPRDIEIAHAVAGSILKGAGVSLVWRDCAIQEQASQPSCDTELGPLEVIARITAATDRTAGDALGDSIVDLEQKEGSFATIYADRVQTIAGLAEVDAGVLLGRTIAHELGHLLLGAAEHSSGGLMRACWSTEELRRNLSSDWLFSQGQRKTMSERLAVRFKRAPIAAPAAGTVSTVSVPQGPSSW
jgi:hypothetical protein